MHGRGVVHRDVKAANILLTRDGHVKLADFGVACSGDQQHNTVIGTPAWMSAAELTRTPRGLRRVRTGYAYQPPALGTYRRRRAACPQGPMHCTYAPQLSATLALGQLFPGQG